MSLYLLQTLSNWTIHSPDTDPSTEGNDGRGCSQDFSGQLWIGLLLYSENRCGEGWAWNGQETCNSKEKDSAPSLMCIICLPLMTSSFLCHVGVWTEEACAPGRTPLLWPRCPDIPGGAHARADQTQGEASLQFHLESGFLICYLWYDMKSNIFVFQVGGVDAKQLAVYEEFARNIPGFLPSNDLSQPTGFLAQPMKVNKLILWCCHTPNCITGVYLKVNNVLIPDITLFMTCC